jgi:hypothetical protein
MAPAGAAVELRQQLYLLTEGATCGRGVVEAGLLAQGDAGVGAVGGGICGEGRGGGARLYKGVDRWASKSGAECAFRKCSEMRLEP